MYNQVMAQTLEQKYAASGHPSIEELMQAQGTIRVSDPQEFFGFWVEDPEADGPGNTIDDFLAAVREWRGHSETDRVA